MKSLETYAASDELADMVDTLRETAAELPTATGRREHDESDDTDTVEFRLYIRPDGNLELNTGDPSYDTDHRGGCGAGAVSPYYRDDTILECLLDALADAYFSASDDDDGDDDDDDDGDTLSLEYPHDDGTHTLAVEHSTRDGWCRTAYGVQLGAPSANGWPATLVALRALYFRLVSYAMEPVHGQEGTRYVVDGHIVSHGDTASLRWFADMLSRHGVSL
jgi:hypothetical protein